MTANREDNDGGGSLNLSSDHDPKRSTDRQPLPVSALDFILTVQIVVGWAGEAGDDPRLGWWRSDLASEYGGEDLFERLLPHTWRWAVLQGVREAARRRDAALRAADHNPDRLLSLFNLGFELDERIDERLQDLKRAGDVPTVALPGLAEVLQPVWSRADFEGWVEAHSKVDQKEHIVEPAGRRIRSEPSSSPETMVSQLVAALLPLSEKYPLPHFRSAP